jgi:cytochrome P450
LDDIFFNIIEQRRSSNKKHDDFLQMLLDAKDPQTGKSMSDRQIRDEVVTIFSAGHETAASALTWMLYLLAKNPLVLTRLQQELSTRLDGKTPDNQDLSALTYTKAVVEEAMRIRPPVAALMRKIRIDTELQGFPLSAGGIAVISIFNIHHHSEFWPNADTFNPNRFLANTKFGSAYIPFGLGPRVCVGNHLAMLELQLLLSMMIQRYDLRLVKEDPPENEFTITLKPKNGLAMRIARRR